MSGTGPLFIDASQRSLTAFELARSNSPLHWNRMTIINGARLEKTKVLDSILKAINPVLVLPSLYQTDGNDSFFIFRNGKLAIARLLELGFRIPMTDSFEPLEVNVTIQYLTVDEEPYNVSQNIHDVVVKRTSAREATLDLRNFVNDPDFKNVYASLHSVLLINLIKVPLKKLVPKLNTVLLSYNDLENLDIIDLLRQPYDTLDTLDIRHNKITYNGIERFTKFMSVKHLLIEGNPVCNDFATPGEMMYELKKMIPSLQILDHVDIEASIDKYAGFKLYMRNPGYADLVDHFLHLYYSKFENDREHLMQLYDNGASLSISLCRHEHHSTIGVAFFTSSNRNILSMSDVTKTYENIFVGKARIHEALISMPIMRFDPFSFKIDVPITSKGSIVVISCTGVFRLDDSDTLYSFSRICVLFPLANGLGEWLILNDMWTIMNSVPRQPQRYFQTIKGPVKSDFAVMLNPELKDKAILIKVVSDLTNMKSAWVEKYLSDSGWDLSRTILAFTDHFKSNLVPPEAFAPLTDD